MEFTTTWQDEIKITGGVEQSGAAFEIADEETDARLVERILLGEEAAFENLFERYKKFVAAIAARYFQRPEEIEEIIQISFAKVFFELKKFRGDYNFSFASWLGKITTNACLDLLRNKKRKPENLWCEFSEIETEILFARHASGDKTPENTAIERDLANKLLSKLSAEDRAVLQMLDGEEMSVSEVSAITGWSNAKIKIRAFRARGALRKILKKFV